MDTTLVGRDTGRELIEMLSLCRTAARYCSTSPVERPIAAAVTQPERPGRAWP
jgi:hypothetical protein